MYRLEKAIEKRLVKGVNALGGRAYKWLSPGNVGVPDRIVIWPGGHIDFIELKTKTGHLSRMQYAQILRLDKLGCVVSILYGDEDVDRYLAGAKQILKAGDKS